MSGRKVHDWTALIQEYVLMKKAEPFLTQNEFFRRKEISPPAGNRKIGPRMALAWSEAQQQAVQLVVEKTGIDLSEELEKQFKAAKTAFAVGARYILPRVAEDGSELPAPQQPATFPEALMLMKTGMDAIRDITKILTGGEPLLPPRQVKGVIEWVAPAPSKPARKTKPGS
jgi:hypothetical protein